MSIPSSNDMLAQLYSFRLIAILCRINPLVAQKYGSIITDVLSKSLIPSSVQASGTELKGGMSTFDAL